MELKKSKKADLRNKQGLFLQVGMLVALALVFVSFQWSVSEKNTTVLGSLSIEDYDVDLIPITRPEKIKEIVIPKVQAEILHIIDDDNPIDDDDPQIETDVIEDLGIAIIPMDDDEIDKTDEIFIIVEDMPIFPGGNIALLRFLAQNTNYPKIAKENGTQGRVFVKFVVNKQGNVEQVELVRGVDSSLDKEALRVVSMLPSWTPGKQRGKAVNVAFNVPINFQLN